MKSVKSSVKHVRYALGSLSAVLFASGAGLLPVDEAPVRPGADDGGIPG
jgi:hypothetical protein